MQSRRDRCHLICGWCRLRAAGCREAKEAEKKKIGLCGILSLSGGQRSFVPSDSSYGSDEAAELTGPSSSGPCNKLLRSNEKSVLPFYFLSFLRKLDGDSEKRAHKKKKGKATVKSVWWDFLRLVGCKGKAECRVARMLHRPNAARRAAGERSGVEAFCVAETSCS